MRSCVVTIFRVQSRPLFNMQIPKRMDGVSFQRGWKPLHFAAQGGHLACVELLLSKNARANCVTKVSELSSHAVASRVERVSSAATNLPTPRHFCSSLPSLFLSVSPVCDETVISAEEMSRAAFSVVVVGKPLDTTTCCCGYGLRRRLQAIAGGSH